MAAIQTTQGAGPTIFQSSLLCLYNGAVELVVHRGGSHHFPILLQRSVHLINEWLMVNANPVILERQKMEATMLLLVIHFARVCVMCGLFLQVHALSGPDLLVFPICRPPQLLPHPLLQWATLPGLSNGSGDRAPVGTGGVNWCHASWF